MKTKLFFIACICIGCTCKVLAQSFVNISVADNVKLRMDMAIKTAINLPASSFFSSNELKEQRKLVIEKSIKTLYHNYLKPSGDILHEGIVPSPTTYEGLWSWDSWKHAYALVSFDKDLAENSVRAMYDYQDSLGMVADCIYINKSNNNYRNTKSPLSVWAVFKIYQKTNDINFLKEMYPKMLKYHYWWYANRDHDHNGLCEYGSNDNTLQAARWECWDNGVRFDDAVLVKNNNHAFSMNMESVDLNSYLFLEKELLIKIAKILNDKKTASQLTLEKEKLGKQIQQMFFDKTTGFFYDIKLNDKSFIKSKEASGWLPLYAKVATKKQAEKVKNEMMNENSFNRFVPLPTVSKDNPKYEPNGYWRGPVWLDQFYFGLMGLKNYGYNKEADVLLKKLLNNMEGLQTSQGLLREYYNPETGKGLGAEMFGWTAASLLVLMTEDKCDWTVENN